MSFSDAELTALLPHLRRCANKITQDQTATEDLVQDTMVNALKARDRFQSGTNLKGWLTTIMVNIYRTQYRRKKFTGELPEGYENILIAKDNPEMRIHLEDVLREFKYLEPAHREALAEAALGATMEELAVSLGVCEGTVKSRISRGREKLLELFPEWG